MVVIVNGYFKVGEKYLNHSAIWEDTENENMTIGNLIDQFSSYIEKVKVKFFEEANDIFETPVVLRISNIRFLFEKFDGVEDILLKVDYVSGKTSLDDIRDINLLKNTQVVQFIDVNEETPSEIFAVPKMFYDSWEGGKRKTDFDLFNNSIDGCRTILSECIGELMDFKFKYINPFEIDQSFGFETFDFIPSCQLKPILNIINDGYGDSEETDTKEIENPPSIKTNNDTNILSIDGMKVAIDEIIWFMGEYYHAFDNKRLMDIIYDEVKNIENGSFKDFKTLYCDLKYVSMHFIHISKSDKALILQFINECFDDAVKILSENNYDMDVNPEEYHISKKLKSYKERIRLE